MTETYRTRSTETWDHARDAYLAGETAESVCTRFDLGLRTFRARAAEQGWRRTDQSDPEPQDLFDPRDLLDEGDDAPEADDAELLRLARRGMARAARAGQVGEALRWARLGEVLNRQAQARLRDETRDAHQDNRRTLGLLKDIDAGARSIEAQARAVLSLSRTKYRLHDLHDLHPVSDEDDSSDADPAPGSGPASRADRRRLLKLARKRR